MDCPVASGRRRADLLRPSRGAGQPREIESFHGRFKDENRSLFLDAEDLSELQAVLAGRRVVGWSMKTHLKADLERAELAMDEVIDLTGPAIIEAVLEMITEGLCSRPTSMTVSPLLK